MLLRVNAPFTNMYPSLSEGDRISDTDLYIAIPHDGEYISIQSEDGSCYITATEARRLAHALNDAATIWEKLNHEITHPFL